MDTTTKLQGTKLRIVEAALDLFARHGFDAVRVEQIAEKVGIKAPSLYKHFKSKQDIFDAAITLMDQRHEAQVRALEMNLLDAERDAALMSTISEDALFEKVASMVRFAVHDEGYRQLRSTLALARQSNPSLAQRYEDRYLQLYLTYHTRLFVALMEANALIKGDAEVIALQYFAPILVAMGTIERQPEQEAEAMELIRRHVHQFLLAYRPATPEA